MATDGRVAGYARAVFEVARAEGVLDRVGDELFAFSKVVTTMLAADQQMGGRNGPLIRASFARRLILPMKP